MQYEIYLADYKQFYKDFKQSYRDRYGVDVINSRRVKEVLQKCFALTSAEVYQNDIVGRAFLDEKDYTYFMLKWK